ncbi:MAG: hydratase [Clostridia bacterium]|nr:hydratase [Clostridia bacterium]
MIKTFSHGFNYVDGKFVEAHSNDGYKKTMAYSIIDSHNQSGQTEKGKTVNIKFDAIASHDITYVGIIQTAKAIGLEKFPIPYVLTNCHNSLCAVGGTINEDDHMFGLSAAKKYGGIFVPPHYAVIHTYMRENFAGCGKMILGSDSHTLYGALGTMAIGEGGPELVKQIIGKTYDVAYPEVVAINLIGAPRKGVGPQDVALAIIGNVFKNGFVKNKVMEFVGEGIQNLPIEYRIGIDVMTTETTCLSSIWATDSEVENYLTIRGRKDDYKKLAPQNGAYYDALIEIDLSKVEPMIALPFHPSNVYTIRELLDNPYEILSECEKKGRELLHNNSFTLTDKITADGKIRVDQAIIAGCAGGTYDNLVEASAILENKAIGDRLSMSVYCGSQPIYLDLLKKGIIAKLTESGVIVKTSFCGPCFGAGDVPANNGLSIRHTTRNFENREGSKPNEKQIASVPLMDARSIAATAANGGYLASALDYDYDNGIEKFNYDDKVYKNRVYNGYGKADANVNLVYGPNIADIPPMIALKDNLFMKVCAVIDDPVTTTDELIPSGETSSYRSNPLRLAEFTLSRKDPAYVGRAKAVKEDEMNLEKGFLAEEYLYALEIMDCKAEDVEIGSVIYARKPGDGSAREQAASCQRVLGGVANIASEYATKRYRSNLINWGMIPFRYAGGADFEVGEIICVKNPANALETGKTKAVVINDKSVREIELTIDALTDAEKAIIKAGCLINYNRSQMK